jgi:hypothetical protein
MGLSHVTVIAAISLSGLLPSSCVKTLLAKAANYHNTNTNQVATNAVSAISLANTRDLGELVLTNHYETRINLGEGRSCTITPEQLNRDSVQLTLTLQSKQADGNVAGLVVSRVTTRPGQPFEVAIGDMDITITPIVTQE